MAEAQDVNTLKRRGRRRLVGAIALVLLAVIVLPMVFDAEPRRSAPPVSVRIPSEESSSFTPKVAPKVAPKSSPATPAPPPAAAPLEAPKPEPEKPAAEKPAAEKPAAEKTIAKEAEQARAEAALSGEQYVVPVAALASAAKVQELVGKLKQAKLPYYTEPLATAKGPVTRVRAGPFASREAAEKARERIERLGLKPGNVMAKS